MPRREYKLPSANDVQGEGWGKGKSRGALETYLNQLGADGWQLLTVDFPDGYETVTRFSARAERQAAG
jgi:hypothetical protein